MSEDIDKSRHEHGVLIYVNNREVRMPGKEATGAEIKAQAGVPQDFKLYGPGGEPIGDGRHIELREGERFTAISGQDVS